MTFLGQDPVRCEIFVDNKCLRQIKNFKHIDCEISKESEKDIQQKLAILFFFFSNAANSKQHI